MDISPNLFELTQHPLHGRHALITGATAGIGLATACQLAAQGVHLYLMGRRQDRLQSLKSEIHARFPDIQVRILAGDVRNADLDSAIQEIAPQLDIFVCNAGMALGRDSVAGSSYQDWKTIVDTNMLAAFRQIQLVLVPFLQKKSGHILAVSSIAGHFTYENGNVYCATKFALRAFLQSMRAETCGTGVRVSMVSPGMVETEFSLVRHRGNQEQAKAVYAGMTPLEPLDIARQIIHILSQPTNVNIDDLLITPQAQGSASKVVRHG